MRLPLGRTLASVVAVIVLAFAGAWGLMSR